MAQRASAREIEAMLLVESNFVIGVVWEGRRDLGYLVDICQRFGVLLVVPEVALAEARKTLIHRVDRQLSALQQLRFWLNDIARGVGMSQLVLKVKERLDVIEAELQRRKQLALEALDIFAQNCLIAPLTPHVWVRAYLRWQSNMPPFKELDCLILESLLAFLPQHKAKLAIFLTLDQEDFDHPELHADFQRHRTNMLFDPYAVIVEFRKFYGVA
jgi:hypothetical protein